jgi:hypothetical protein
MRSPPRSPGGTPPRIRSAGYETDLHGLDGQYIYRLCGDGWIVARLVRLAHLLPVADVALHELGEIDTNYWFEAGQPTVRNVVQPVRHAIHEGPRHVPSSSAQTARVIDGMYRIARMRLDDPSHIWAVRLEPLPLPTYVTWRSAIRELMRPLPR